MVKLSTNFFMTPEEASEHALAWMQKYALIAVVIETAPQYHLTMLRMPYLLGEYIEQHGVPERLCFTLEVPNTSAKSAVEFIVKNPQCLVWDMGKLDASNLNLSCLSTSADEEEPLHTWRKIISELDEVTKAGMMGMMNGLKILYEKERYTPGAARLNLDSVSLVGPDAVTLWPAE